MPKQTQLVSQYLENVSRDALSKYRPLIARYARNRHGIYALYRKGKLYYVGLAGNLPSRLRHHLRDRHAGTWDRFSMYLTIDTGQLRELEALALRIVMPKGNKQKGKLAKAENLRRRLAKDLRKVFQLELADILPSRTGFVAQAKKVQGKPKKSRKTGRTPTLIRYDFKPMKLRARYKGKVYSSRVLKDGTISYRGKVYNSPSMAGKAAIKRSVDGWYLWEYQRAPGDWVKLDQLRK